MGKVWANTGGGAAAWLLLLRRCELRNMPITGGGCTQNRRQPRSCHGHAAPTYAMSPLLLREEVNRGWFHRPATGGQQWDPTTEQGLGNGEPIPSAVGVWGFTRWARTVNRRPPVNQGPSATMPYVSKVEEGAGSHIQHATRYTPMSFVMPTGRHNEQSQRTGYSIMLGS